MIKLVYISIFLAATSLLSCQKKVTNPSTTNNKTTPTDTNSGKIYTIAGNGYTGGPGGGYTGDGGAAIEAELHYPAGVIVDASKNFYICDCQNNVIRKVNNTGIITTIAGTVTHGYSGDGGPATAAELHFPNGIALDGLGNIYFSDYDNQRIRKITPGGVISTFAGNGYIVGAGGGYSGDGGIATAAEISSPYGLAVDDSGNVYIADFGNGRIRKINTNGIILTIAGCGSGGQSGDGGPATAAEISPQGVALDGAGNLYIADFNNNRIRKVNTSNIISTLAGNGFASPGGGGYSGDGGLATAAELYTPTDVVVDGSGDVYFADCNNYCIRMINTDGIISTITGNGTGGYSGDRGLATAAEMSYCQGISLDNSSNLYIVDMYNDRIRIIYK